MAKINEPPTYFRAAQSHGIDSVERDGGRYEAGLIRGVSIITRGEALGHDLWVDRDFLSDVTGAINAADRGIKARFTHPGLSGDGIGTKLGTVHNAYWEGDQVFADLHFQRASHVTPDGNLADYVMTLAEETPDQFGVSIVFEHDQELEEQHTTEHMMEGRYISPDEDNKNNFPHAMLHALRAADVVDEPAANPDGLFKRGQEYAQQGDALLSYALGLTDAKPEVSSFGVDGDRAAQFLARFLTRHNLSIQKGGDSVSEEKVEADAVDMPPTREEFAADLGRFVAAFGAKNGAEWFTNQVSFEDAQGLFIAEQSQHISTLQAKVQELEETLASLNRGEDDGVEFQTEEEVAGGPQRLSGRIRISGRSYN